MHADTLRDRMRSRLLPFTDRAFAMLPAGESPRVLDIGCGTGVPTVRLALLGARVVGLDRDRAALAVLRERARAQRVADRIDVCAGSLEALPFPDGRFDVVWCEGALHVLGFRESVRQWKRLLLPGGVLVAHDEVRDAVGKLRWAEGEGFTTLGFFTISDTVWWEAYYAPVSRSPAAELDETLRDELRLFREHPARFRSAFFLLRRCDEPGAADGVDPP